MSKKPKIAIAGVGNLGWNLATKLVNRGFSMEQLIAEKSSRRSKFAKRIDADLIEDVADLKSKVNLLFVCLPDDEIAPFASTVPNNEVAVVHCSGSTALLSDIPNPTGVFYPFQTFTKFFSVDWDGIPIFIESKDKALYKTLRKLGQELSMNVLEVTFEQRKAIHMAGVFGANFTNHLLYLCKKLLDEQKVPIEVLKPLLEETVRKAFDHGPAGAQTGPARRNDTNVIDRHTKALESSPDLAEFYRLFTNDIIKEYNS